MIERNYKCQQCGRTFKRKSWFDKHDCKDRQEFDQKHGLDVVAGHRLFVYWQTKTGFLKRGKEKTQEEFRKSPLFSTFMGLAAFVNTNNVSVPLRYVDYLVDKQIPEAKWKLGETLAGFINEMRLHDDPELQANNSVRAIQDWATRTGQPMGAFFREVSPGELVLMVKNNQLSPWVLFGYDRSLVELVDRLAPEYLYQINEYVNTTHWMSLIRSNEAGTSRVNSILEGALG
jgi:hypothetical protein